MPKSELFERIAKAGSDKESIAADIARSPGKVSELLAGLTEDRPEIRFGCSKVLRLISMKSPAVLYPQMDRFISMLEDKNTFLRLDAARVVANLAAIDAEGKIDKILDRFFVPISGPTMIPAANAIAGGATIALARPDLAGRISAEILKVASARYATRECRNVALGHAIKAFDCIYPLIEDKAPVVRLIRKQLKNTRPATRKKAELFVKRHRL